MKKRFVLKQKKNKQTNSEQQETQIEEKENKKQEKEKENKKQEKEKDLEEKEKDLEEKEKQDEEEEEENMRSASETEKKTDYLYPLIDDPKIQMKIALKDEFSDTKAHVPDNYKDIKTLADTYNNKAFELSSHQLFIKNFISFHTPYRSLLLYHGLGSGKTCSAIQVSEVMRHYYMKMNMNKKIMIIASPNVQIEIQKQLFDPSKLREKNGLWYLDTCVGNELIKEINPTNMQFIHRDKIVTRIQNIIHRYYAFFGYNQFANFIAHKLKINLAEFEFKKEPEEVKNIIKIKLKQIFRHQLIVIDEAHNLRISTGSETVGLNKLIIKAFLLLLENVKYLKLLLLSATPMYNSPKEIVNLINIMHSNDNRPVVAVSDIFKGDELKVDADGNEVGKQKLEALLNGYVSYVKGDNPYTFPYRIYPSDIYPSYSTKNSSIRFKYGVKGQLLKTEEEISAIELKHIDLFLNKLSKYQSDCYLHAIQNINNEVLLDLESDKDNLNANYNFTKLIHLLNVLIIVYPNYNTNVDTDAHTIELLETNDDGTIASSSLNEDADVNADANAELDVNADANAELDVNADENAELDVNADENAELDVNADENAYRDDNYGIATGGMKKLLRKKTNKEKKYDVNYLYGKEGIQSAMNVEMENGTLKYSYRDEYKDFFKSANLQKYSSKISNILRLIQESEGIILVYSQYIYAGLIPFALALEEMGIMRYNPRNNLLKKQEITEDVAYDKFQPRSEYQKQNPDGIYYNARYSLITGDIINLSRDKNEEMKVATSEENKDGKFIRIILISQTAAEGLDFKNIRQLHILDPWYNLSLIEQIIGRAVRFKGHKDLEFEKRNVEIYRHGSLLSTTEDMFAEKPIEKPLKKSNIIQQMTADVYIYKIAETKAIKMGYISRIIKQTAVDCILNKAQQFYTHEQMNIVVDIITSTNRKVKYQIGDKSYSPICDYMESCAYKCKYEDEYEKENSGDARPTTHTYSTIHMNLQLIIDRILEIFKTGYHFHKKDLVRMITAKRYYSIIQIDAALDFLIHDRHTLVYDMYMRPGHIVNIGMYYLFQPIEMTNAITSRYDRVIPIDFKKNDFIPINMLSARKSQSNSTNYSNSNNSSNRSDGSLSHESTSSESIGSKRSKKMSIVKLNLKNVTIENMNTYLEMCNNMYVMALDNVESSYLLYHSYKDRSSLVSFESSIYNRNWYYNYNALIVDMNILKKFKIQKSEHDRIVLEHIVDQFTLMETMILLNYICADGLDTKVSKGIMELPFVRELNRYWKSEMIRKDGVVYMYCYNEKKDMLQILRRRDGEKWAEGEYEDWQNMDETYNKKRESFAALNSMFGFYSIYKSNNTNDIHYVFKVKDILKTTNKNNKGFRCDQTGKTFAIELLMDILKRVELEKYVVVDALKLLKRPYICVLQEIILRLMNMRGIKERRFFLKPYEMIILEMNK